MHWFSVFSCLVWRGDNYPQILDLSRMIIMRVWRSADDWPNLKESVMTKNEGGGAGLPACIHCMGLCEEAVLFRKSSFRNVAPWHMLVITVLRR